MDDRSIELSDGRTLGYVLLGDPDGSPVFFFHGTPGSRLILAEDDPFVQVPGVRWIVPERPGYGISDPEPARTLLDWPDDVAQLADHLGLERFVISGVSGGGPHALVCAHHLGDRVTRALIFCSPSPADFDGATRGMAFGNRLGIFLGRHAPGIARWLIRSNAAAFAKNPGAVVDAMARQMAAPDRALMKTALVRDAVLRDFAEAYRQGSAGHEVDGTLALTSRDWGFSLRQISVPVLLWHGEEDTLVTLAMAKQLEHEIPDCTARFVPGAAHLLTDEPAVIEEVRGILSDDG